MNNGRYDGSWITTRGCYVLLSSIVHRPSSIKETVAMATTSELALLCLSGLDTEEFLDQALHRLLSPAWQFMLLYVIDTRPVEELGYHRQALFRGRLAPEKLARITGVEDETAQAVIAEARA